ncbi:MAG TPA: GNAT family N-acetyltransferase [Brevundimonas sp.]
MSVLAFADGAAAGLVNAFEGFSTFKCAPVLNVHDVAVLPQYRGLGLARRMLHLVEVLAIERNCCKLTLEVLEGNQPAKALYRSIGFTDYSADVATGQALFWEKSLSGVQDVAGLSSLPRSGLSNGAAGFDRENDQAPQTEVQRVVSV